MASLTERLISNSTIATAKPFRMSSVFAGEVLCRTKVPMFNVALSGKLDGGLTSGLTIIAGKSKHFKTGFSLLLAKSFLDQHDDGVILFYDSEFGASQEFFQSFDIDLDRVIHIPVTDIEQLKFDVVKQIEAIEKKDNVFVLLDSMGNLASKKEVDDAENQNSVADMSRAKAIKSLFRIVTPHLTLRSIPFVVVNHVYDSTGLFARTVVSGGSGLYYSADTIFVVGRAQDKKGAELQGYHFKITIDKSRFVREKSIIPITVGFDSGISSWSGLLDIAMELGYVSNPSKGWYSRPKLKDETKSAQKFRTAQTNSADFWKGVLNDPEFRSAVEDRYSIHGGPTASIIIDDDASMVAYEEDE